MEKSNLCQAYNYGSHEKNFLHYNQVCNYFIVMATLRSTCGHYIFVLWCLASFLPSFFLAYFSAVQYSISTILPHMVWP